MNTNEQSVMTKISLAILAVILLFFLITLSGCGKPPQDDDWLDWSTFENATSSPLVIYESLVDYENGSVPQDQQPVAIMVKKDVLGMKTEYTVDGKRKYSTILMYFENGELLSVQINGKLVR